MITQKLELTNEQSSPLFRIMWVHNASEPNRRHFDNNISAFHIGNGFVISVAHNLKTESQLFKSIPEPIFQTEIIPALNPEEAHLLNQSYPLDLSTNKRYINIINPTDVQKVTEILKNINFDTRWIELTNRDFCKPHLIIQFKDPQFYKDSELTAYFKAKNTAFQEPSLNRHTFLVELDLVEAYYSEDIALYRIINTHPDIIKRLPQLEVDFTVLDDNQKNFYCLQSSPGGFLGRLLNKAKIEGFLDHHGSFTDRFGGNYILEGLRYLIKGYFRFGSSGAPYVFFDAESNQFKANAVQSEACPIQLSINNNKDGNFQYINALASPLYSVQESMYKHLKNEGKTVKL
ncbi:MAG: hypothetical protein WCO13_09935 [Bacteroidota bacterium]